MRAAKKCADDYSWQWITNGDSGYRNDNKHTVNRALTTMVKLGFWFPTLTNSKKWLLSRKICLVFKQMPSWMPSAGGLSNQFLQTNLANVDCAHKIDLWHSFQTIRQTHCRWITIIAINKVSRHFLAAAKIDSTFGDDVQKSTHETFLVTDLISKRVEKEEHFQGQRLFDATTLQHLLHPKPAQTSPWWMIGTKCINNSASLFDRLPDDPFESVCTLKRSSPDDDLFPITLLHHNVRTVN